MSIIKWTPFLDPFEEMERMLAPMRQDAQGFVPAVDIYEEGGDIVARAAIPNLDPKDIQVNLKDNVLTISGKTEHTSEVDEKNYYRKEIKSGSFMRSVLLPRDVDEASVTAKYDQGVLLITAPVKEKKKDAGTSIKVEVKK